MLKKQFLLGLVTLMICQGLQAHPHSWVELTTDFMLDSAGELYEIRQRWIFDPYYSTLTIDDLKKTYGNLEAGLAVHGQGIVNNLESLNYYSHLSINGQNMAINKPVKYKLSSASLNQEALLILEMHFQLPKMQMQSSALNWQVYDPTYYVSMRHDSVNQIRLYNESSLECEPNLVEPDPNDDVMAFAQSLDVTDAAPVGLGEFFAQTIEVTCF